MVWGRGPNSFFSHVDVQLSKLNLLKRLLFSTNLSWYSYRKSMGHRCMVYFWTPNSVLFIYMPLFMWMPHPFDYCSFVVSTEISKCNPYVFISFWDCFGYLGLFHFHINFRISMWISAKKSAMILIGIVFNLFCHLKNI